MPLMLRVLDLEPEDCGLTPRSAFPGYVVLDKSLNFFRLVCPEMRELSEIIIKHPPALNVVTIQGTEVFESVIL